MTSFQDQVDRFLADAAVRRTEIDRFLDPEQPKWAQFDSDLGYVPHPCRVPDGIGGSVSTYTYGGFGERISIHHAGRACRINSYGDSFTQCHQVSDGETWQEYLAAHLGEPIRNFGVGGYGVYQAALRLGRTEATDASAEFVLFNIYLDDHYRNLDAFRMLRVGGQWWDRHRALETSMFHANPWRHVRFEPTGALVDMPNPCPTGESLYQLCSPEFLIETFRDDLVVQMLVGRRTGRVEFSAAHKETARALGVELDPGSERSSVDSAERFYRRCAFRTSRIIVERVRDDLAAQGKKLLVLLSYPDDVVADACGGGPRPDSEFLQDLDDLGIGYVDSMAGHVSDYKNFTCSPREYVDRLYHGHYTPAGNHWFAFLLRPTLVDWLRPGPPAYATRSSR